MSAMIVIGGGACVGGQMSDHTAYDECVRRQDKLSYTRQLNGGCTETAMDSNLIGLHLPRTIQYNTIQYL